jgi:hypothetical protein
MNIKIEKVGHARYFARGFSRMATGSSETMAELNLYRLVMDGYEGVTKIRDDKNGNFYKYTGDTYTHLLIQIS